MLLNLGGVKQLRSITFHSMENLEPYSCVKDLLPIGLSIEALQIDIKQV